MQDNNDERLRNWKRKLFVITEILHIIFLITFFTFFWIIVGINVSSWKFWALLFMIIALLFEKEVVDNFREKYK
jgi:hypothetical protein